MRPRHRLAVCRPFDAPIETSTSSKLTGAWPGVRVRSMNAPQLGNSSRSWLRPNGEIALLTSFIHIAGLFENQRQTDSEREPP